jgi:sec-independent protein translocase protein TatB
MFGFNFSELVVIAIVALVVFGPDKLPKLMSELGKWAGEFKKSSDSLRREFYNAAYKPADEVKVLSQDLTNLVSLKPVVEKKQPPTPLEPPTENTQSEPSADTSKVNDPI